MKSAKGMIYVMLATSCCTLLLGPVKDARATVPGCQVNESARLTAFDGAVDDWLGYTVAIDGDTAVVGAVRDDDNGSDSGSTYVFRRYVDSYPCPMGTECAECEGVNPPTCAAGICEGNCWIEEAKLLAFDGASTDQFGYSVAISGDVVVVGAPGNGCDAGIRCGSAYAFAKPAGGWGSVPSPITEAEKLTASDAAAHDEFGISVGVSVHTAVVGAFCHDDNGTDVGSAYVFRRYESSYPCPTAAECSECEGVTPPTCAAGICQGECWIEEAKLLASDGAGYDHFGESVAIFGEVVVAGAWADDDNGYNSGSAYVFYRYEDSYPCPIGTECTDCQGVDPLTCAGGVCEGACWIEGPKLLPQDGAEEDYFGHCVDVSGDVTVIGAFLDNDNGPNSGSAYVFRRYAHSYPCPTGTECAECEGVNPPTCAGGICEGICWIEEAKLLAFDGAPGDYFSERGVAIYGDVAVIGAHNSTVYGAAYVFRFDGSAWTQEAKLLPPDVSDDFGFSVDIFGDAILVGARGHADNFGAAYVFHGLSDGIPDECGACCGGRPCIQVTQTECDSLKRWYAGDATICEEEDCDNIPAVSEWGLVVFTLLLLAGGSIVIVQRRVAIG